MACRDIAAIRDLCQEKAWWLVEDICEAMGTRADDGQLVGTFGDFAVTSRPGGGAVEVFFRWDFQ